MGCTIGEYALEDVAAVKRFNTRIAESGSEFVFPEQFEPDLMQATSPSVYQQYYVAREGVEIRGGYKTQIQPFSVNGTIQPVANYQLPLSEGVASRKYAMVGPMLVRDVLRKHPQIFALGMGGLDRPLPRLLDAMGWTLHEVPFFFRVRNGRRFLLNLCAPQISENKRRLMRALGRSGLGGLAARAYQFSKVVRGGMDRVALAEEVGWRVERTFGSWVDSIWDQSHTEYAMIGKRSACALNALYPPEEARFIRLRVFDSRGDIGWMLLLDTPLRGHRQFGRMRLGSIVDGLSLPGREAEVVAVASRLLESRPVDLIISNQCHAAWQSGLLRSGFMQGPSNYVLALSRKLVAALSPIGEQLTRVHMTRGDGDGPIHL